MINSVYMYLLYLMKQSFTIVIIQSYLTADPVATAWWISGTRSPPIASIVPRLPSLLFNAHVEKLTGSGLGTRRLQSTCQ
jgi:hypothetical protein